MTKLCPRGKAAAKRKFKVYPSAYANAYASKICAGKIKDPSGKKRKDFRGPKPVGKADGGPIKVGPKPNEKMMTPEQREKRFYKKGTRKLQDPRTFERRREPVSRKKMMGGGMMQMPRPMYGKGGGVCKRGMNRQAIGKNS